MRITVFGASGAVGSRVVAEAVDRGHTVTAVSRDAARLRELASRIEIRSGDAANPDQVAELSADRDVVISATRPGPGREEELAAVAVALLTGLARTEVRLLVVGGAAGLRVPGGAMLIDTPDFPSDLRPIAFACNQQLDVFQAATAGPVDWAYVSPPTLLEPGVRTGCYRVGAHDLLVDAEGNSFISMEDFAVALLDEAERPKHHRTRFTVGY
ncbi:NAD(P)-dependent oxidoreductase [Nocardia vaccinii]|uniref:NAD(P)-dependent oxidoreductase n=1 Tax=Nocardia vaccinii TaxID=1822 RepID=UPI0008333F85|nr:NAD(P)H-binding protein [Nocardia vaccinii]